MSFIYKGVDNNSDICYPRLQILDKCEDEEQYDSLGVQRAAGWCEAVEERMGTDLRAAVRNPAPDFKAGKQTQTEPDRYSGEDIRFENQLRKNPYPMRV